MIDRPGRAPTFFVDAALTLVAVVFIWTLVHETAGRSLEDVQRVVGAGGRSEPRDGTSTASLTPEAGTALMIADASLSRSARGRAAQERGGAGTEDIGSGVPSAGPERGRGGALAEERG